MSKAIFLFPILVLFTSIASYKVGHHDGAVGVFEGAEDVKTFEDWKESCTIKWNAPCGLSYFELDGVGVYQVGPYKETK